ncbi:hypothetical protein O181_071018 [Austropuccinia psidii MF-1]|uniref:Uncharacterized protein n=1 Tax=Austropuccinia psidii MF-1 TaxID=1389203 RepID=A0A9Q3F092_9BASI|nr:hypothetical protein [Austropuccinia psidii MF-1]
MSKRKANSAITSRFRNPTMWREATSNPDKFLWVEALKTELDDQTSRGIVIETSLPKVCRPFRNLVQFKRKFDNGRNLIKKKVHICAQGFSQKDGVY